MSEQYEIVEAAPIKRPGRQGAGRRPEPNPFEAAVGAIVNQADEHGDPIARSAKFDLDAEQGETLKQRTGRIRRFLTRAGKELAEKQGRADAYRIALVTSDEPGPDGKYVATFWHRNAGQ